MLHSPIDTWYMNRQNFLHLNWSDKIAGQCVALAQCGVQIIVKYKLAAIYDLIHHDTILLSPTCNAGPAWPPASSELENRSSKHSQNNENFCLVRTLVTAKDMQSL